MNPILVTSILPHFQAFGRRFHAFKLKKLELKYFGGTNPTFGLPQEMIDNLIQKTNDFHLLSEDQFTFVEDRYNLSESVFKPEPFPKNATMAWRYIVQSTKAPNYRICPEVDRIETDASEFSFHSFKELNIRYHIMTGSFHGRQTLALSFHSYATMDLLHISNYTIYDSSTMDMCLRKDCYTLRAV